MIVVIFDFNACSVTASIKIFVFIFAERRCVFGMVGAVPACPPERPHSGVSIPKIHALCIGNLTTDAPLQGDTGWHTAAFPYQKYTHCVWGIERWMRPCRATRAGTQAPPLPISTNHTWCAIISSHCTFDSSKPRGVPLPHRGYTFDSAGLASATQPTLGNNAGEEATPLGVVLLSAQGCRR